MLNLVVMTDPEHISELRMHDTVIRYTSASGDEVLAVVEDLTDPKTGEPPTENLVTRELMRRHIKGWEGVVDLAGDEYEYAPDRVAEFVAKIGGVAQGRIGGAIVASYREAAAGKGGSKSGSSGTD